MRDDFDGEMIDDEFDGELDDSLEHESEQDIHATIKTMMEQAESYYEEYVEPRLVKATEYYNALPFGNEKAGRSNVIMTSVRDAIRKIVPSMLRITYGKNSVVEYRGYRGPEDDQIARQKTAFVNHIIKEDNPGFSIISGWIKDGLLRQLGVVKYWAEKDEKVTTTPYTGLSEIQLETLLLDESVEVEITEEYESSDENGPMTLYDATIVHREDDWAFRVEVVPPEELRITPRSRNFFKAPLVAHSRPVPANELVDMGIPLDMIEEAKGDHLNYGSETLRGIREPDRGGMDYEQEQDDATREVLYTEAYVMIGKGDGRAERRMFQLVGPAYKVANGEGELVEELPFATWTPDPEPHTIKGLDVYDMMGDLQLINSKVLRSTLDSLTLAIDQKTEIVEGEVNTADLMRSNLGGYIRVRRPGMIREIEHSFVGVHTLPLMEFLEKVGEDRSGQSRASAGLDADAFQSSTKTAVAASLAGSQQQIEMFTRVFAEQGMKRLFEGLQRLITQHQPRKRMVRMQGRYVEIDPRLWNADMDVTVNVALGGGSPEEKLLQLDALASKSLELMGMGIPFITNVELRNTLGLLVEAMGYQADQFYLPWTTEQEQAAQQAAAEAAQQQQGSNPEVEAFVQIEQAKIQARMQEAQAKMQLDMQRDQARFQLDMEKESAKIAIQMLQMKEENDRERDKIAREFALKAEEIEAKYAVQIGDLARKVQADRSAQNVDEGGAS